jgi:L-iditol 2-dehydrogenase
MRAAVIDQPGALALRDIEIPTVSGDEVLVKVSACGVCATDLHIFQGDVPSVAFPIVPGHEAVGMVAGVGPDVGDLSVGQRAVVEGKAGTGFTRNGAYAEYLTVPRSQIIPLADHVDAVDATLIDPLACAINAVNRAEVQGEQQVVVVGMGSSGLCTLAALKALTSARVAVVDRHDDKLEIARQFGAELTLHSGRDDVLERIKEWTGSDGAERVIEVTGKAEAARLALSLLTRRGRLVVYGVFDGPVEIDLSSITFREAEVVGAVGSPGTYELATELVSSGRVNLRPIVSRTISLGEVPDLFSGPALAKTERKVVVSLSE